MRKVSFLMGILAVGLSVSSCKKEGCTDERASNYDADANEDDNSCVYPSDDYEIPTTYSFERNGESTVSFSGQTDRMNMLSEMTSYLKTANTPGTSVDAQKLKDMYANENSPFSDAALNSSTKQLKSKTAGGDGTIQLIFESYMDEIAIISANTTTGNYDGANGTSGVVQSGSKQYLFNANGGEYTQFIEKGLMGAVFYHQIANVYLGDDKMNVDNEAIVDGKNYTVMEHHWDEAFGYFTDAVDFPANGTDRFWGKYCNARDEALGSNKAIMDAYLKGRAAIVNKDMETRDAQRTIIRNELQKVVVATALDYFEGAKANLADDAIRNHELSEGVAFLEGIAYGYNPVLGTSEVEALKTKIGNNYYEVKTEDLDFVIAQLSTALQSL